MDARDLHTQWGELGRIGQTMELFLQFGYGMMEHCRVLLSAWGGGTTILSPQI